jgi:hypothetical protein
MNGDSELDEAKEQQLVNLLDEAIAAIASAYHLLAVAYAGRTGESVDAVKDSFSRIRKAEEPRLVKLRRALGQIESLVEYARQTQGDSLLLQEIDAVIKNSR